MNSRVSSSLMKRRATARPPRRGGTRGCETASFASRIFPSRSETNTGSGASSISLCCARARVVELAHVSKDPDGADHLAVGVAQRQAFRLVGITSQALRGFSTASRVTPRSTTSRSAAVNSLSPLLNEA